jgi:hypothetical protein
VAAHLINLLSNCPLHTQLSKESFLELLTYSTSSTKLALAIPRPSALLRIHSSRTMHSWLTVLSDICQPFTEKGILFNVGELLEVHRKRVDCDACMHPQACVLKIFTSVDAKPKLPKGAKAAFKVPNAVLGAHANARHVVVEFGVITCILLWSVDSIRKGNRLISGIRTTCTVLDTTFEVGRQCLPRSTHPLREGLHAPYIHRFLSRLMHHADCPVNQQSSRVFDSSEWIQAEIGSEKLR